MIPSISPVELVQSRWYVLRYVESDVIALVFFALGYLWAVMIMYVHIWVETDRTPAVGPG